MSKKIVLMVVVFAFAKALVAQSTVVELFTSQGCSSCPPADELLADIEAQYGADVITLSYHVDYWDYIGWKDPFASRAFTLKQYAYAEAFGSSGVYTPQAVINGNSHFTGSDGRKMGRALKENKISDGGALSLGEIKKTGNKLFTNYTLPNATEANSITFALTLKERTTAIKRGENRNRTLTNHNIVIDQTLVEAQQEGSIQLSIPAWVAASDALTIVAYATKDRVGIIDAVTKEVL